MDIDGEYSYTLHLTGDVSRKIGSILNSDLAVVFHKSLTIKNNPKIYIVHRNYRIYYVGYAGQPIRARLRYGLNPQNTKGYAGYKWKHEGEVSITIFTFSSPEATLAYIDKRLFVEAVGQKLFTAFVIEQAVGLNIKTKYILIITILPK
jgi:hypothetical protein